MQPGLIDVPALLHIPPLPNSAVLAHTGMADTALSSGLYEEKNPIDRKRC
jgi:hypothetical protein